MIEAAKVPPAPTQVRLKTADGRMVGVDGSVWAYRVVPLAPVADAKSPADRLLAAEPLMSAYEEIANITPVRVTRRALARGDYRQTHGLLINIPTPYLPARSHPLYSYLRRNYGSRYIDRRLLLFGVRLRDKINGGSVKGNIESLVESLIHGQAPLADYDADFAKVSAAFDRAGLRRATPEDMRLADAWWNFGGSPDSPTLMHADHLHFFTSVEGMRAAKRLGTETCESWEEHPIPGEHAITFASVRDFDLPFREPTDPRVVWASHLLAARARVVSVRGLVEPTRVTRGELRRQRRRYIEDIKGRYEAGKMERAEQEEMLELLGQIEGFYAGGDVPPTLTDASVVIGFDGRGMDIEQVLPSHSPARLSVMAFRQQGAFAETQICSAKRVNPHLMDLPAQTIGYSGLPALSVVGDRDGALLGFTEADRQPAYISPTAASTADGLPAMLVAGATGSGKTMLMLKMADEFARLGKPVIVLDPKTDSHHDDVVLAAGGQVASLDSLMSSDGIFDPLRFAQSREIGAELAISTLLQINPWGTAKEDLESSLHRAINHGVKHGATCTGQALQIAAQDLPNLPPRLLEGVMDMYESPMFRASVGFDPHTQALRVAEGLTLIKVGGTYLDLPDPGHPPNGQTQRINLALVRNMVFGSAMALIGRGGGVVEFDEAWTFLGEGGAKAMERIGRLARQWGVLPILFTQRVSDAVNAGLSGYISRGVILPIEDEDEARAACDLFKLEPTKERLDRIMAKGTIGDSDDIDGAPNWNSMRALRDPGNPDRVLRGAIGIYIDLAGRAVPTEVVLGQEFLRMASTRPEDVRRRAEERAARQAAAAAPVGGGATW